MDKRIAGVLCGPRTNVVVVLTGVVVKRGSTLCAAPKVVAFFAILVGNRITVLGSHTVPNNMPRLRLSKGKSWVIVLRRQNLNLSWTKLLPV